MYIVGREDGTYIEISIFDNLLSIFSTNSEQWLKIVEYNSNEHTFVSDWYGAVGAIVLEFCASYH